MCDPHMADFSETMSSAGVVVRGQLVADGCLNRVHVQGDKPGSYNGWYICFGGERPAGAFGSWRTGEKTKWSAKGVVPLTLDERRELQAKVTADRARRAAEQAATFSAAAVRANAIWDAAVPCEVHPYLARKHVPSFGLRVADWTKDGGHDPETGEVRETRIAGALLVPIRNARKEIVSLQAIFPDTNNPLRRDKDYLTGGEKRGCWYSFGAPVPVNGKKTVIVCEGYATGVSVHRATSIGVVVAFDAGNLRPVAEAVRRAMPDVQIIIAADNDRWTFKPIVNPGLVRAREAAAAVGGFVAMPVFTDVADKPTDFNDLDAAEGAGEVWRQILAALGALDACLNVLE
jgi:putative DNA primase/helicase